MSDKDNIEIHLEVDEDKERSWFDKEIEKQKKKRAKKDKKDT